MTQQPSISALDLAALLCSKICHDIISPIGAINNGMEVMEDEQDPKMIDFAQGLVKKSAVLASAKLQFMRIAFGAAGSAGSTLETDELHKLVQNIIEPDKMTLHWKSPNVQVAKSMGKLLLNLCHIGLGAIPRGGEMSVEVSAGDDPHIMITAKGPMARKPKEADMFEGNFPEVPDAYTIQTYFAALLATDCKMKVKIDQTEDCVTLTAS